MLCDGEYGIIESASEIYYDKPETTYNFEVEDFHTYYVGESNVLVHNTCSNVRYGLDANDYDEALDMAKQKGGVSGDPIKSIENNYKGYDLQFRRKTRGGDGFDVWIREHMTGHPNRGIGRHLNVVGVDGKNWHIFFRR